MPSNRDGRYGVPRSASLSADEQQRMQQYNHMITSRNIPQPNISPSGALPGTDRGGRILPGGNGMGLVCGVNRSMPMGRPGFQGIASSIVNSGSMVSPGMSSANMHSGVGPGQGSSMLRPREALHMMRVCDLFLSNLTSGSWSHSAKVLETYFERNFKIRSTTIYIN